MIHLSRFGLHLLGRPGNDCENGFNWAGRATPRAGRLETGHRILLADYMESEGSSGVSLLLHSLFCGASHSRRLTQKSTSSPDAACICGSDTFRASMCVRRPLRYNPFCPQPMHLQLFHVYRTHRWSLLRTRVTRHQADRGV